MRGPNGTRLENTGDFNIELPTTSLIDGVNTVVITATDTLSNVSTRTVTINYEDDQAWPLDYTTDWAGADEVSDAAQVVDGLWMLDGDGVRIEDSPSRPGTHPLVRVTGEIEGNEAVRAAADIVEQAPDSLIAQIQLIDATDTDQITVELGDGSLVEWGDAHGTSDKSEVLRVLMREHPPQEGRVYDVGTPDLAIVR